MAAAAIVVAACALIDSGGPVAIQTEDAPRVGGCKLSELEAVLVGDPAWGLAVRSAWNGRTYGVVWPFGYSARREQGRARLLDASGAVVATEGDRVILGPGPRDDGVVYPCTIARQ